VAAASDFCNQHVIKLCRYPLLNVPEFTLPRYSHKPRCLSFIDCVFALMVVIITISFLILSPLKQFFATHHSWQIACRKGVQIIPDCMRLSPIIRMSEVMSFVEIVGSRLVSEREQRRILAEWRQDRWMVRNLLHDYSKRVWRPRFTEHKWHHPPLFVGLMSLQTMAFRWVFTDFLHRFTRPCWSLMWFMYLGELRRSLDNSSVV